MRGRSESSAKLFLTELMIAIFFFALVAAVCVQLFVEAHSMSVRSEEMIHSVNIAANVAECYSGWDFREESWQQLFPEGNWQGDTWQMYYDEEWRPCVADGNYLLEMQLVKDDVLCEAHITIKDCLEKELYSLITKRVCRK